MTAMPAIMTHYLHAKRVAEQLAENEIELDLTSFYWGAQGPDFFLGVRRRRQVRQVSSLLHKLEPQKTFSAMRDYIVRCPEKDRIYAISYAYGFLCHLALDSGAHPFVYWFQKELAAWNGQNHRFVHHKIERNLDVIMLEKELGKQPAQFRLGVAMPWGRKARKAQSRMMEYVIRYLFPDRNIPHTHILSAYRDYRWLSGLLQDKRGWKRKLAAFIQKHWIKNGSLTCAFWPPVPEQDWDYVNSSRFRWTENGTARGRTSTADFYSIFEKAVEDAVYLAGRFKDCADHNQPIYFLEDYAFHNGCTA